MAVIWIINQYGYLTEGASNSRHGCFAKLLGERGHQVTLIHAKNHHLNKNKSDNKTVAGNKGCDAISISTTPYSHANDKRRVLGWLEFSWKITRLASTVKPSPDVILVSSPSLISFLGAYRIAKSTKAKLIFEFRDIWPASMILLGKISEKHPFILFLKWVEKIALKNSDHCISTMEGGPEYVEKLLGLGHKCSWIPNAAPITAGQARSRQLNLKEPKLAFAEGTFIAAYAGTIGSSNSVDTIIEAAIILRKNNNIGFVVMGEGSMKATLVKLAQKHKLTNVQFTDHLADEDVGSVLHRASVTLLCWKDLPIYDYGTSPNKLPLYLKAGKPIIQAYSGSYDPIKKHKLGITVPSENASQLAAAVLKVSKMDARTRNAYSKNAKALANKVYSYESLVEKFEKALITT
ncbi:MAG: glycosyltransferase family 4 protein [Flavobacteriaceae bacterium]